MGEKKKAANSSRKGGEAIRGLSRYDAAGFCALLEKVKPFSANIAEDAFLRTCSQAYEEEPFYPNLKILKAMNLHILQSAFVENDDFIPIAGVHSGDLRDSLDEEISMEEEFAGRPDELADERRCGFRKCLELLRETQDTAFAKLAVNTGWGFQLTVPRLDRLWAAVGGKPDYESYAPLRLIAAAFMHIYFKVRYPKNSLSGYTYMLFYRNINIDGMGELTIIIIPRTYYPNGARDVVMITAKADRYKSSLTGAPCSPYDPHAVLVQRKGDPISICDMSYFGPPSQYPYTTDELFLKKISLTKDCLTIIYGLMIDPYWVQEGCFKKIMDVYVSESIGKKKLDPEFVIACAKKQHSSFSRYMIYEDGYACWVRNGIMIFASPIDIMAAFSGEKESKKPILRLNGSIISPVGKGSKYLYRRCRAALVLHQLPDPV